LRGAFFSGAKRSPVCLESGKREGRLKQQHLRGRKEDKR
jgi:hypothetical protein